MGRYVNAVSLRRDAIEEFDFPEGEEYIRGLPVVRHLDRIRFADVTFIVGENGTGKSTLTEAIALNCGFNAEGGSKNFNFSTRRSHSMLANFLSVEKTAKRPRDGYFLRAESFFALMTNRFFGKGLYILDEPEAALSASRVMSMLTLIHDLCVRESQLIISTHSPILLAYPEAVIYELRNDSIAEVPYRETSAFRTMKQFLDQPERMAKYLTAD